MDRCARGEFSWDASAEKALDAFEALHERRSARLPDRRAGMVMTPCKPRLAFVSSLPPERSEGADYSAELIPELAPFYDMSLSWIGQ